MKKIQTREDQLRQRIKEIFFSSDKYLGKPENPNKLGFLYLAEAGKDIWNAWRKEYPSPIPDFSDMDLSALDISFSGFEFPNAELDSPCAMFSGTIFGDKVDFSDTKFGDGACFENASFGERTTFRNAVFGDDTSFKNAVFISGPSFRNSIFDGFCSFAMATFGRKSNFSRAKFIAVDFTDAKFADQAMFYRTVFSENANFSCSNKIEQGKVDRTISSIYFCGSHFNGPVSFANRKFTSTTDFGRIETKTLIWTDATERGKNVVFNFAPNFHGCEFHQDTSFDGAVFETPLNQEAARAFRTLKLAMEQLKATREEQRFFRLEMKAEHSSLPWGKRWISTLYNLFSDYGFSLWRPIAWLLVLSLLFGTGYGLLANACAADRECAKTAWAVNTGSAADRTSAVIKYTLASVSPVPGLDKMQTELRAPLFGHHGWIPIAALVLEILHKIIALVMVFLFALALRNLFKMKS